MSQKKPILFNTEMTQATLDRRKKATRRVVKGIPNDADFQGFYVDAYGRAVARFVLPDGTDIYIHPLCETGDILYVRETWANEGDSLIYRADADKHGSAAYYREHGGTPAQDSGKWHPSIHMPKEAARIFLRVTNVRVERVQDITEDGMIAEGTRDGDKYLVKSPEDPYPEWDDRYRGWIGWNRACFEALWNSTLKEKQTGSLSPYRFCFNPWVWVYEFERVSKPEVP